MPATWTTPPLSTAEHEERALLYRLFTLPLTPTRQIRLDPHGTQRYDRSVPLPDQPPPCPHALHLTDFHGRYRLLVLDLDAGHHGPAAVLDDLHRLTTWLHHAAIPHLTARSGPTSGGRHVWIRLPDGAAAPLVADLATALRAAGLSTLDHGLLHNPRRACARPPGSLHRHGGYSRPELPTHGHNPDFPLTEPQVRDAAQSFLRGTTSTALRTLISLLPTSTATPPRLRRLHQQPRPPALFIRPHHRATEVLHDTDGTPYLSGPRPDRLGPTARRKLHAPLHPHDDHSAALHSVLLSAALARRRYSEIRTWLHDPTVTALEHCRSRRHGSVRIAHPPTTQHRLLARAWSKAVTAAATLPTRTTTPPTPAATPPPTTPAPPDATAPQHATDVLTAIRDIQQLADDIPWRWSGAPGPADRLTLDALCLLATRANSLTINADVRTLAEMTGHGKSTMGRALQRLATLDDSDHRWLHRLDDGGGTAAATYRLLPVEAQSRVDTSGTQGQPAPHPHSHRLRRSVLVAVARASSEVLVGPAYRLLSVNTEIIDTIDENGMHQGTLGWRIQERLAHHAHDVWTYRDGLGHHVARVHWALVTGSGTADAIARVTGYTPRRVGRYLRRLEDHALMRRAGTRLRTTGNLSRAAARLAVLGTNDRRGRRHAVERTVYAWWREEQLWRTAGAGDKQRALVRIDRGNHAVDVIELPLRKSLGSFPVRIGPGVRGRAHYPRAHALVRTHLGMRERQRHVDGWQSRPSASAALGMRSTDQSPLRHPRRWRRIGPAGHTPT